MNGRAVRLGLGFVTLALMLAALYMVFDYVPTEADQGIVQRIFYFHVPLRVGRVRVVRAGRDRGDILPVARPSGVG